MGEYLAIVSEDHADAEIESETMPSQSPTDTVLRLVEENSFHLEQVRASSIFDYPGEN